MKIKMQRTVASAVALLYTLWSVAAAHGYSFNMIVPDVREPASVSGGSACPIPSFQLTGPGSIAVRWSTVLGTSPTTIITTNQTPTGQINELQQVIQQSISVWTGVAATSLPASAFSIPSQFASADACASDGIDSICFDQADPSFTPGVLAFTRVITADAIGIQVGSGAPSTEVGEILDADIYFNPSDSAVTFATPSALAGNPQSYDLESLLIHEFGHLLGFSHSDVWRAIMFPFAAAPGTFTGLRPTTQQPDAPLADDDRAGLRTLYPDAGDTQYIGSIEGQIFPASPLSLPISPPSVTGVFGSHVVALDMASGAVMGAALGGWSCQSPGPTQFDGTYLINHLPIGHSYLVYVEPLDGAVPPSSVAPALTTLCRNSTTDPGWPTAQACVVPAVNTQFTTRMLPAP
jgi:hypothetical protein